MEWVPKLYDTVDSLAFELRTRWAGHVGANIRGLMLLVAVLSISAVSPLFRNLVIASVGALMLAEITVVKLGRGCFRQLLATRRKATI
jgi:hypothetical protein